MYIALHIECRFNKNSSLQSYFLTKQQILTADVLTKQLDRKLEYGNISGTTSPMTKNVYKVTLDE